MCQFNLAIVDSDSDDLKLKKIFEENGLYFSLIKNPSLNKLLGIDMKVIFTTKSHCDCGSAIGFDSIDDSEKRDIEKEIKKLKCKGWSDGKIKKYLENKEKNDSRKHSDKEDSLNSELLKWTHTIRECFDHSIIKKFGILTHFYTGRIEDEKFEDMITIKSDFDNFNPASLRKLEFDQLLLLGIL